MMKTGINGIGCRQRKIMDFMMRYGQGALPSGYRLYSDVKVVLEGLIDRGLVERDESVGYRLSEEGREAVTWEIRPIQFSPLRG